MAARYAKRPAGNRSPQGPLLDFLAAEQSRAMSGGQGLHIVNLIHACVKESVVEELAKRPMSMYSALRWVEMEWPQVMDNTVQQDGPGRQWNLEYIEAYAVWDAYGLDGTGVVVGMIDTGTHLEHEALQQKWRGYDPQGNHDPIYNWFDAVEGRPMPYDIKDINYCHGTHVMGTILGGHSETNNLIGVAPGAKWITARAFIEEGGYDHWLLAAGQYLLAPTDADGEPNPAMAPDVINNSWGGGPGLDEWYRPMVQAWREPKSCRSFRRQHQHRLCARLGQQPRKPSGKHCRGGHRQPNRGPISPIGPTYDDDLKPDLSAPAIRSVTEAIAHLERHPWCPSCHRDSGPVAGQRRPHWMSEILAETAMPDRFPISRQPPTTDTAKVWSTP